LRNEWLEQCGRYLAGHVIPEQQYKDLVLRANTLNNHQDSALRYTAELIAALSPPPKAANADGWTHVFTLATNLVFSLGQHHSGWTLEDRQTEERRFNWFSEKESQTASGQFNDEELEACRALWDSENEAYQLKEEAFFDNQLQGLKPILNCMRSHLATLVHSAPPFNPI
jgi:thioredoxin 1